METPNRRGRFSEPATQLFEIKCESISQAEILILTTEGFDLCRTAREQPLARLLTAQSLRKYCRLESRLSLLSVVIGFSRAQPQTIRCSALFPLQNPNPNLDKRVRMQLRIDIEGPTEGSMRLLSILSLLAVCLICSPGSESEVTFVGQEDSCE
jgi:hypothetical protein